MFRSFFLFASLFLACGLMFADQSKVEIRAERLSTQPILSPAKQSSAQSWYSFGIFNPTATKRNGKTILLFRAQDGKHTSRIGYAESTDGLHFTARPDPVLSPETDYETGGGLEDPRVVEINGTYYLTYTGYNLHDAQLCLATSADLIHWKRVGVILPAYKGTWNEKWTKSGAIIPNKINGKWWMYYLGTRKDPEGKERDYMGLASSNDLLHWRDATREPVLTQRPGAFDSRVMEPGPAPILTDKGILLLYNGADDRLVYGPGWVLFDRKDPSHVLDRADHPFVLPKLPWEINGNVPNVIFLEGAVRNDSNLNLTGYYGAADKYIGALSLKISVP
ncbi:MAG TPA: glycoside hydrolase family 130 protein [Bryobacteraceae bacterium]